MYSKVSVVQWLSRSPNTRKVPGSSPGGNSFDFLLYDDFSLLVQIKGRFFLVQHSCLKTSTQIKTISKRLKLCLFEMHFIIKIRKRSTKFNKIVKNKSMVLIICKFQKKSNQTFETGNEIEFLGYCISFWSLELWIVTGFYAM